MNIYIDINDIYVKHWILFPYETKRAIGFINPHHCFAIKDSIHYKCIANKEYQPYVSMITTTSQREHSLDKFLDLEDKINNEFLCKNKITVSWCDILNKWCVTDGCHRLAILLKQNITLIKKEWIIT
jgi:hypothetical protein